jgi:hypothetical protein
MVELRSFSIEFVSFEDILVIFDVGILVFLIVTQIVVRSLVLFDLSLFGFIPYYLCI